MSDPKIGVIPSVLLILLISSLYGYRGVFAQTTGSVFYDGEPVVGATVFIAGTATTSETDGTGKFELPVSDLAWYDIAAWHPDAGFGVARFEPGVSESVEISLEDVYADANGGAESDVDLDYFREVAFAWTGASKNMEILNPEVLIIRSGTEQGVISAVATAPLRLSNPTLGYLTEYHGFQLDGSPVGMEWTGYPLFKELTPDRDKDIRNWKKARENTYEGSRQHFLHALALERLEKEDFEAFHVQGPGSVSEQNPVAEMGKVGFGMDEIDPIMRDGSSEASRQLMFQGWLYVHYLDLGRGENRYTRYVERYFPSSDLKEVVRKVNRSWIRLPFGVVNVDPMGTILPDASGGGIQTFGYWTFNRLADLLPYDYAPED